MRPIHTGSCGTLVADARVRPAGWAARVYCLHDPDGRLLGRIEAPVGRPELGRDAATVYLQRDQRIAIR